MEPRFFRSQSAFRAWLTEASRRDTGAPGRLLQEGVGEAQHDLARIRRRGALLRMDRRHPQARRRRQLHDPVSRRAGRRSIWSAVNIKRAQVLADEGKMQPTGRAAFEARNRESIGDLRLRAAQRHAPRNLRAAHEEAQGGVVVLPGAAALVPEEDRLVDRQRRSKRRRGSNGWTS